MAKISDKNERRGRTISRAVLASIAVATVTAVACPPSWAQDDCSVIRKIVDSAGSRFKSLPGRFSRDMNQTRLAEVIPGASQCTVDFGLKDVTCHYLFESAATRQVGKTAIEKLLLSCLKDRVKPNLSLVNASGGRSIEIYLHDDKDLDLNVVFNLRDD